MNSMKKFGTWLSLILIGVVLNLLAHSLVSAQPPAEDIQKEAEEARRAMEVFLRDQKLLFKKGEHQLELDTFYSTDTETEFILVGSTIGIGKIQNRSAGMSLIARYGILDVLELNVQTPFLYTEQEIDLGVGRTKTHDEGLGDVRAGLRYQFLHDRGTNPDAILELNVKSRTGNDPLLGTGHWNVGSGVTLVKTIDPVVLFGHLGYAFTLEREGRDPGDQILYQMGMGFSLNDRVSLNMQVNGAAIGRIEIDGMEIGGSSLDIINLQFGVTVRVTKRLYVEPVVSAGLTEDATDVFVGINFPYGP